MSAELLKPVENPNEVILRDDETSSVIIIVSDEHNPLEKQVFPHNMLKWCGDEESMHLTLGSIMRQLLAIGVKGTITVIHETALDGTVYRFGNHGAYWEQVGLLAGFA